MKINRFLLVGLVIVSLVLAAGFAIPVLAHGPGDGETAAIEQETWEAMHEACESGDWEAMSTAADEAHGEDLALYPAMTKTIMPS